MDEDRKLARAIQICAVLLDPSGQFLASYGVRSYPTQAFIDKEGKLAFHSFHLPLLWKSDGGKKSGGLSTQVMLLLGVWCGYGVADVVVTDGFTGNAVLKSIEGTAMGIMGLLKTAITGGGLRAKLGALLLKDSLKGLKTQLNYSDVGGAVLFGVKAPVVKTHGSSDANAVYSTIRQIRTMLETDVVAQTAREFSGE